MKNLTPKAVLKEQTKLEKNAMSRSNAIARELRRLSRAVLIYAERLEGDGVPNVDGISVLPSLSDSSLSAEHRASRVFDCAEGSLREIEASARNVGRDLTELRHLLSSWSTIADVVDCYHDEAKSTASESEWVAKLASIKYEARAHVARFIEYAAELDSNADLEDVLASLDDADTDHEREVFGEHDLSGDDEDALRRKAQAREAFRTELLAAKKRALQLKKRGMRVEFIADEIRG